MSPVGITINSDGDFNLSGQSIQSQADVPESTDSSQVSTEHVPDVSALLSRLSSVRDAEIHSAAGQVTINNSSIDGEYVRHSHLEDEAD